MDKNTVIREIMDVIHEVTDIEKDEMSPESAVIDDLDMNSLEILTMLSKLERHYQIKFVTKDLRSIITIEDIADYMLAKLAE